MNRSFLLLIACFTSSVETYSQDIGKLLPINNLLKPHWSMKIDQWYGSDDSPLLEKGILFLYSTPDYAVDVETGEKLYFHNDEVQQRFKSTFSDSLVIFDYEERTVVVNLYNGKELLNRRIKKSSYIGRSQPVITNNRIVLMAHAKENHDFIKAVNVENGKDLWTYKLESYLYTKPVLYKEKLLICANGTLMFIDLYTGAKVDSLELSNGETNSNIEIANSRAYVWTVERGIVSVDIENHSVLWNYNDLPNYSKSAKIIIDKDTLYIADRYIYALNTNSGELLWKSEEVDCVSSSYHLAKVSDFILFYQNCYDAYDQIFALDLATKKLKYMSFTSEDFMPEQEDQYVHILDYLKLDFTANTYNSIIVATDKEYVYAFKIAQAK